MIASLRSVELRDSRAGKDVVDLLLEHRAVAMSLRRLELVGCELTDEMVLRLSCFHSLEYLDLSRNKLTCRVTALAHAIPALVVFRLKQTSVGVWDRMKLARQLRRRQQQRPPRLAQCC